MSITEEILESDQKFQLHHEGKWNEGLKKQAGYTSFNDAGIESEVGEFLYGMVRVLQPDNVLETGTHVGVGAAYLGMGLAHNLKGHLSTVEFLRPNHEQASARMRRLGIDEYVTCHYMDVANFTPNLQYDLILLDTEPQTRFAELIKFYDHLKEGGYVFIHDLHRHMAQVQREHPDHPEIPYWPWGEIPEAIKKLVREDKLRPMHFPTPRGLTGFYKPSKDDYQWK